MNDLWLKIKVWTKAVVFLLVVVYAILFAVNNRGLIDLWVFPFVIQPRIPVALVVLMAMVLGVLGTLFVRTLLRTLKQMRDLKEREQQREIVRDFAERKEQQEKATRLQTRDKLEPPEEPVE